MVEVAKEWRTGRRDVVHRSVLTICQVQPDQREAAGLNTPLLIKVQGGWDHCHWTVTFVYISNTREQFATLILNRQVEGGFR